MTKCDLCGGIVELGDWPFCHGNPALHEPLVNHSNAPMQPYVDDMIDRQGPREFTTIGEKVKYMDRNGIIPRDVSEKRPGRKLYFT